ncbi:UNKNOWN [Stylonychia lemnae]|uniref:Sfi1 spindle body domain-containing protein n=1 Tax=Stylonychia lemnae TaxID=5949 RepID=A0A078BAK3_STYLE|nr:UNKNOWN [Stylonychia lemnae]|eukprot:CDW91595.1 UNKNOWN [Stylonychia lemnae]
MKGYHNQPNVYISQEENLFEDQLVMEPQRSHKASNQDMPLSGVGQNLQHFLSNTYLNSNQSAQNTANFNSIQQPSTLLNDNSNSLHDQLLNIQSYENSSQQMDEQSIERGRSNYQANQFNHTQQQRSLSHGQGNNIGGIGNKQVRFTIKDGLKNLIEESNIDLESVASRGEQIQKQNKMERQQKPPAQQRQTISPTKQSGISKSKSPKQRKVQDDRSTSQQRKTISFKSRKLALKYKRNADESRKKKIGDLVQLANADDDLSQVPDFSNRNNQMITGSSKMDRTPEKMHKTPPKPTNKPQVEILNYQEYSNKKNMQQQQNFDTFKNFNSHSAQKDFVQGLNHDANNNSVIMNSSQLAGCIVKRNDLSKNRNDISNNLSKQSQMPGTIMRKRSTSPADALFLGVNKENSSLIANKSILAGQINHMFSPKIHSERQLSRVENKTLSQTISIHAIQGYNTPQFDQPFLNIQENIQDREVTKETKIFLFKTVWEALDKPINQVIAKFESSQVQISHIRNQMLQVLSQTNRGVSFLNIQPLATIAELRDRRQSKIQELRKSLRSNHNQNNQQIKIELLRDIISRLQQKLVIAILRLNRQLKIEINAQFSAYYQEFIMRDYLSTSFNLLKKYQQKRSQKNEYMYIVREQVGKVKLGQLYNAWKNIKHYKFLSRQRQIKSRSLLVSRKIVRILQSWKITIIQERNVQLGFSIAQDRLKLKYHQQLFLRWIYHNRSSSKIKRKALLMVSPGAKTKSNSYREQVNDEEWFQSQMNKTQSLFNVRISEYLLEREHNKTFINGLKFKLSIQELNTVFPLRLEGDSDSYGQFKKNDFTNAYRSNVAKIYQDYPELRNKTPVKKGASINSNGLPDQETWRNRYRPQVFHSFCFGVSLKQLNKKSKHNNFRIVKLLYQRQSKFCIKANQIVKVVSTSPSQKTNRNRILREHIKTLQYKLGSLQNLGYNHHFKQSLIVNAQNVIQDDIDQFSGLTDYIQYGISCDQYRMVFISMFKTKAISVLLSQWKTRFVQKQLDDDLQSLHILNISKQAFIEWSRVIKARKLKIKDFHRTIQVQKHYKIFQKWADWNKQAVKTQKQTLREFKLRTIFKQWIRYLDSQGQNLMKILRSQQYYKQALMSKSLLSLYQHYLKTLRVKRFQKKLIYKKFFLKGWKPQYAKIQSLRRVLLKIADKIKLNERFKYQREFELKRETIGQWKERVDDKKRLIQHYTALTHYRQNLILKSFMAFKKNIRYVKGLFQIQQVVWRYRLYPIFQTIKNATQNQKLTESSFLDYRQNYLKAEVFNKLRQNQVEGKLAKLFMKKRVFKAWQIINYRKNHELPSHYRAQKLQQTFFQVIRYQIRQKWAQERSYIIQKNLIRDRQMRVKKVVFLKFLENILIEKKSRIIDQTINDFRRHTLMGKAFGGLRQRWSENNREQLMNKVAKDFYLKIIRRRDLRRRQYYESKGISYKEEGQISKHRVFTSWRMHIEHKMTKSLVLKRFLDFKRRFKMLRSFLAWRSYARYENTPSHQKPSRDRFIYESSNKNYSSPSHNLSQYYDLPLQTHSPQVSNRQHNPNNIFSMNESKSFFNIMPHTTVNAGNNYTNIIGDQDLTQIRYKGETPMRQDQTGGGGDKSLFDELENIFQKNKKWLDEQREREDFLREMAQHYNQRLSQEMNTLRYQSLSSGGGAFRSSTNFN